MEPALLILIIISLGLAALAVVLWLCLLTYRTIDNSRRARREAITDRWLGLLLPVLEGEAPVTSLPKMQGKLETEAVLGLLRDLAERFRGQYRQDMDRVLRHIGAEQYGMKLVRSRNSSSRLRGCGLLAWTGPNHALDDQLTELLQDRQPNVRLEAAYALCARGSNAATLRGIMGALRGTAAIRSDRARDIVRLIAPRFPDDLVLLLAEAQEPREKVLLLEGMGVVANLSYSDLVVRFLLDEDARVRIAAIATLELLSDPHHIEQVTGLARDANPYVRHALARYAASMNGDLNCMAILEMLSLDRDFEVRRTAVHALAAWGGSSWDHLGLLSRQDPLLYALMLEAAARPTTHVSLPAMIS